MIRACLSPRPLPRRSTDIMPLPCPPLPTPRTRKELMIRSLIVNHDNSILPKDVHFYDAREDLVKAFYEVRANTEPPPRDMCDDLEPWADECKIYDV